MSFLKSKIMMCFFRLCIIVTLLLSPYTLFAAQDSNSHINYIIDTDIGGDIDDVIALLVAINSDNKPLAVTTTHIEPVEKAKIAKLILKESGYPDIPVYAGIGVTRKDSNENFLNLNPLWPPDYGYPNPPEGQKKWYEKQAVAYKEGYGSLFDSMQIENESAPSFIARIAKKYSPESPLTIVALGPLHNIDMALLIDSTIKNNIIIYSMGGSYPKGYNWLISPEVTARVLAQIKTICISSEFIDQYNLQILPDEFSYIERKIHTKIGKAIISDWKNWHKIDKENPKVTQLGDPVTLFLALHPEQIKLLNSKNVVFPCLDSTGKLKSEFLACCYSMPGLENKLIKLNDDNQSIIKFVYDVYSPIIIKNNIIRAIV